jgi:hypothetical protein
LRGSHPSALSESDLPRSSCVRKGFGRRKAGAPASPREKF